MFFSFIKVLLRTKWSTKMNRTLGGNASLNLSSKFLTSQAVEVSQFLRFTTLIMCIIVITLGAIGNGLVLIVFGVKWSKLKSCEIFMLSLALADFLNATVAPLRTILDLVHINLNSIGHDGCKTIYFISITTMTVSALTLLTVSIDRFIIVKWPLHERPYQRTLLIVITCTWLSAGAFGSFYFVGENIKLGLHTQNVYSCFNYMGPNDVIIFTIAAFCIQCAIPITVMTILYSLIILELRKNANSGIFAHCKREMKLRLSQNRKATKMIFVVVLVFYFCILPTHFFYMWYLYNGQYHPIQKIKIIFDSLTMLQMCNSVANPIIYSRLHTTFKKDITKVVFPCCYNKLEKWESMQDTFRSMIRYGTSFRRRSNSKSSLGSYSVKTRTSITSLQHQLYLTKRRSAHEDDSRRLSGLLENQCPGESPISLEMSFFGEHYGNDMLHTSNFLNCVKLDHLQRTIPEEYEPHYYNTLLVPKMT